MTTTEDTVLVREIGKLAGFLGGFGARSAARRLPVEESVASLTVAANKAEVQAGVAEIFSNIGKLTDEFASETPEDCLSAIVGSGQMNLNPTIVHVHIVESSGDTTLLSLRALAKEGLMKQQSAQRAIERIKTLLLDRWSRNPQ